MNVNINERAKQMFDALGVEILRTSAGSADGQFPILDLIGNLRDEAAGNVELVAVHSACAGAWEKMVRIVESGKPFSPEDIEWLNGLLTQIEEPACGSSETPPGFGVRQSSGALELPAPRQQRQETTAVQNAPAPAGISVVAEMELNLNIAGDADLLREFITESREHLDNIEQGVLVLEKEPVNVEMLNTVFRAFHTFKGGAGFLNLVPINRLAHILESLLDLARQGKFTIASPTIEIILRGRDVLKQFLDEIDAQVNGGKPATPILIPTESLKAEVAKMIELVSSGKMLNAVATPAEISTTTAATSAPEAAAPAAPSANGNAKAMVRVDTGKLDGLLDLVGEMVIAQSLVAPNLARLSNGDAQFSRNVAQLNRITRDLQRVSMSLRMVPIRGLFQKMARVARDISAKQNKKVNFITSGEDTELDRGVVEELNDPLLHMIRNSMDHGIESAEKRAIAGKPSTGSLQLRAYHQGGSIVVEIEDDGAGLNRERILAKAVERGLVAPGAILTDEEIYHYIFAAGFSTAEKVTDLSGRGVGLDVVRRNIEKLRGTVDISSKPGTGTLFKIALPLTLAIIDGLVIGVGAERYIIPTLSVRESFRPTAEMISRIQNRAEVVNVRGRLIPLLRLHEIFGIQARATDPTQGILVVVQSGANVRCLLVDALLHKQEVVIKNLNEMMVHKNPAFAGATILGDGRVGLILDVNALAQSEKHHLSKAA